MVWLVSNLVSSLVSALVEFQPMIPFLDPDKKEARVEKAKLLDETFATYADELDVLLSWTAPLSF